MKTPGSKGYAVPIPIEYIRKLGWQARQKVVVTVEGDRIIIEDWKK